MRRLKHTAKQLKQAQDRTDEARRIKRSLKLRKHAEKMRVLDMQITKLKEHLNWISRFDK